MRAVYRRSRIAKQLWKTTALTTLALGLSGVAAYGDDAGLWQPQIRAIVGADNNGGNAALEGFIPIKQSAESVLFLDVRAKHDFKDASGQDIGLGIRRIVNPDLMLGGYAYINLENYNSTQFTAATLGVEAITPNFDAHVNVFVPIKGDSTDHSVSSSLSMVSNQLIEQISVLDHRDYAAWGIEGEVGAQVPINLPDKHSLRLDIGGYHFEDPHGDDGSVTGAKAGFEYTIGDVFGSGTELVFAGEVRNDNRDDTQFAGSVRLNIPFNPGHSSDTTAAIGTEPVYPVSEGLRKRVNERVRGDIGVRVQSQDKIGGSTTRVAINAATNAAFGKFYFADGGLAGAGTQADPTTLDDAVTKAGNGGFVVALGGNGNLTTAGTTLATGQTLIGGGESVTAKLFGGGTATFNLGGSDGTIQGTNVANNVITLGNGNTLNGITITGGADGIFGNNVTGTTLTNVTVTGAGGNGAEFTGNSTNVKASGFTATGNGLDGLHIEDNGTYNFTGTTLLSGNLDDGLDITGQGTYSFATVNALNNTDRGITVQGTSSGGSFTTTGGTVSGNGGVGVFIDPITAHVVLDSITQTGGTSGVVLDQVSGSFTVNGATTISNTTGPAIAISNSPATIRFGDIAITNPGADGMSFSGVNAAVVAGNIVISGLGLGQTGLDFSGSQTTFTALSANISGAGAGSIGIDLADTTGDAAITITNGGSISGVDTGVRLGISGSPTHSANAEFTFGGGSIAGVTASLDARGLNQTLGHYAFGSTTFSGPQLFDVQNVIFVGASASGTGDGSSLGNLATIGTADGISASNAIFVLVNNAGNTPIDASGGFSLSDGQTLASFGNGRSFSLGGVPVNVTGANIEHDQVVSDPGGGAATLTNSGAGAVVTAANGNSLLDFDISGGSAEGINATGITGLTIQGVTVSGGTIGLLLDNVAGTVSVKDLDIQNPSQTGIALVGSSATANFTGNTTVAGATNVALFANNFDGTATFDDLDITGGGIGVGVVGGSSGTLTFGSGSSIAGTTSNAVSITNSTPNFTYNGTINQTAAASAVKISNMTGGSATFGGKITASTGAANAIDLTGNTGGTINFTGGLDLTTDGGFGFSAINGGTLNVTGTNTIATGAGPTEKGIQLGGAGGLTIGASGVTFASVTVDGSGGAVPTGILIENTSGGNVTFGAVNVSRVNGDAIRLSNIASGTYTFNGTTTIDTVGGPGPGFVVQNSAATVSVNNLVTTGVSGADVSLTNNTGTIGIGGTITNSGSGDGVVVSGGSAAITVSAAISSSATAGSAVKVDGITGGSVAFSGSVTSTGTGNVFNIGSTTAPTGGTISFTGSALTATGGGGGVIAGLGGSAIFNATAPVSITNATGNGLSVSNVASGASATFGAVTVSGATGNGIDIGSNAGSVTFGTATVTMGAAANTAGINFSGTNANVSFGTTNVTLGAGANQTGIDFSGSSTAAAFGLTTITGNGDLTSRGIDLSSTTGNKTITFLRGSSISNVGVGVDLSSGGTTATSANANFTFGDGTSADGLQSSISAAAGGYTVNTIGLDPTLGNYNFNDVFFTGSAHLASAVGGVIMVSQSGGVIAAGTDGLSAAVTTISVAQADALLGTQTFAFVGTVDLSGTPFTLDSGQSITGFGNGNSILTSGTVQPVNVQGNLGATGGNVTGDEGVVKSTGSDTLHLLGSNQVRNTAFDFTGGSGSVFTVDQSAGGFNNAGGIFIDGVTVSNVAAGQTAIKIIGVDTNVSITNNNINVAGTLLDANGGAGDITLTRGTLPNSGPAGTLTGGGISIANRTGGTVDFTDKVTVNGNSVSLTNNTGATITFADLDVSTSGATAFTATGGGTVNVTTGTIANTNGQAVALEGITAGINFASTNATFSAGTGIDLQNLAGTAAFGTGTLSNTGSGTAFNVGSATAASAGNAVISYGGTIASNGTGAAASIQGMTGGSVTLSGNLTDGNATDGGNIVVAGNDSATITFSGSSKVISSGTTDAVSLGILGNFPAGTPAPNTNSAINFTGGGLDITTTTGAGFVVLGDSATGAITVTGASNTIKTTTGTALSVDGATVGAGGVTFDSVSVNGAATGIALNNVSGGGIGLGVVDLQGITAHGIDISGTLGSSISATSIDIRLNATNAVGLDLNGALLGSSTITAGDFDVDGGSFAGTIGIDMAGTTGTGTIQFGDTVNNNPAGQTSTIKNVGYGVQFSSVTNAKLVFGDGAGPAESSIATTGGQVIHATDSLPTNGDYNFNDVNLIGDTSNLASISVYYVTAGGTGDGSLANPGSYAGAQASTANVVVLIDQNVNGAQETIDLGGTSFQLDDGQVLLAFKSGDAAVDVSQLGVDASGGASAAFHFTTIQNTSIISAPGGIDTLRPVLQSNTAGSVVDLATTGTGTLTGGIANLIIRNTGTGTGVAVNAASASSFFLRNNDIAAGGRALDFSTTGAPANTLLLSIDANTLQSTGSALAASFAGQNISATDNSIAVRSFAGNTVTGGTGGGINFTNVRFDADGVGGTVSAGTLTVGNPGARVQGDGLSFINTSGTLDLGALNLANNGGTGVLVDTKGANTTFTLNNSGGTVDTTNGAAFNLDPLTVDMTFGTVTATGGASGIIFDGVAGTFTVTGTTTITGTSGAGVSAINTNTGTFNFNTLTVNNAATAGGGIALASGTLNVTGLANIDTTSGAGLSQTGGTTAFTGGLTIDTSSGDGFFVITGGAVTVTGAANTVTTATGRVVSMQTATIGAGGVTFQTLKSTGTVSSGAGIQLSNVSGGVFNGGDVSIAGSSNNAITVQNGTSSTVNFNSAVVSNATFNGIDINTGVTGTVTFGTVTIDSTGASGVRLLNTSGTVNINGGSIGATDDPAGIGVEVSGGAATLNVAAAVTKTSAGKIVDISGVTGGTVTLSGNLSATGGADNGINVQSNTGGTFNFTGATKTLTTGANTAVNLATNTGAAINFTGGGLAITTTSGAGFSATGGGTVSVGTGANANTISTGTGVPVNMNGVAVAAGGVNFASTSNGAGGTSGVVLTNVTGAGTVNLGTGTLVGGSAAAISISGGSVNLTYAGNVSQATAAQALLSVVGGHTGTLTFNSGTLSATNGTGLQFDNADGTYNFNGTTTLNGGDAGVDIVNGSAGNFGFGAGTSITNPTGVGFNVNGGTGNITYAGTISKSNNSSNIVSIQSHTGGTTAFSGTISATGSSGGIALSGNTGATINFSNTLTLTGSNTIGFSATGGGTISATGTGSVISSGTATALNVTNTSIGSGNLVFQSISTNGATNGIVLNNTGLAAGNGGLTVTGTGTTSGSGGTIQNAVQGALFTSTKNLSLSNMNFTNANSGNGTVNNIDDPTFNSAAQAAINMSGVATGTFTNLNVVGNGGAGGAQVGINGQNVSNLTLANSTVTGFGDAAGEGNVKLWNLSGTSAITNSTFGFVPGDTTGGENLVEVRNNTGTLTLNISGSTFQNTRDSTSGSGGFAITTIGSAVATVNVSNSTFTNLKTSGVEAFARDTSTLNVNITDGGTAGNGNTFTTGGTTEAFTGRAIGLNAEDTAQLNFNINRNKKIYGFGGPVINIYAQDNASIQGRINNNADIENNATGTNFAGSPIYIHPQDNATGVVEVIGNTIINNGQDAAISANVEGDGISRFNASLDLTIQNNNITLAGRNLNANSFNNAILLSSGASDNDATILTVNLQNNVIAPASINGTTGNVGLAIENTGGVNSHLYMEGFTTDPTTTWNNAGNTPVGSVIELDNIAPLPSAIPVGHNGGHTKTPTNPNQ
ncbi:hypothetical protein [Mesorhizobium erdmanii]|uniref:hypothetical protein n=1 Tax=Mesorhizobium erdmanii TaxID=1777866 RepID=UPI000424C41D|nr:hypothetical protein [Mesorhizobium erdmanii]